MWVSANFKSIKPNFLFILRLHILALTSSRKPCQRMSENVSIGCRLHCLIYPGRSNNDSSISVRHDNTSSPPTTRIEFAGSNQAVLVLVYFSLDSLKHDLGHSPQFMPEISSSPDVSLDPFEIMPFYYILPVFKDLKFLIKSPISLLTSFGSLGCILSHSGVLSIF